jgi:CRP-like cAMP-binding protein
LESGIWNLEKIIMADQLKHVLKYLVPFTDQELQAIVPCFKPRVVKRNEFVLRQGEVCREFYFVAEGCIRTYFMDKKGSEKTRYIMPANYIGTALSSFIDQKPSFEFIDALQDSTLLAISHHDFYRLNNDLPAWKNFYQKILEMAYAFQTRKIESIVTLNAQQRFTQTIQEMPGLLHTVSNKVLASYLDITPETLSRLKQKIKPS